MRRNQVYKCAYVIVFVIGAAIYGIIYYGRENPFDSIDEAPQIRAELQAAFSYKSTDTLFNDLKPVVEIAVKEKNKRIRDSQISSGDNNPGVEKSTMYKNNVAHSVVEKSTMNENNVAHSGVETLIMSENNFVHSRVEKSTMNENNVAHSRVEKSPMKKNVAHMVGNKYGLEQILRDSVDIHHRKRFVKPENEKCEKRLPGCIILGVAKSGTRELMDFMRLHPHIELSWRSATYENPYFGTKYFKGEEWFKNQMPCSYSNQITVMKNAWYFHNPSVPKRIKSMNKAVKLIVIVREPVSRAISYYSFFHRNAKSYEGVALIGNEVNKKIKSLQLSIYDQPMKRWLEYFERDQFLILDSNELKKTPAQAIRKVEEFLGLEHFVTPDMFVFNKKKWFYCIQSDLTANGMACYAQDRGREPIRTKTSTIRKLQKYFKPHNEKFFQLIGKSFDWGY